VLGLDGKTAGLPRKVLYMCWAVLMTAGILLGWVFWSVWWPFEPLALDEESGSIANHNKMVDRGGTLMVRMKYCKHTNLTAQMVSSIEQGASLWLLSSQLPAFTLGCHDQNVGLAIIPVALPIEATTAEGNGMSVLRVRLNYRINPLREVTYSFVTEPFTINP